MTLDNKTIVLQQHQLTGVPATVFLMLAEAGAPYAAWCEVPGYPVATGKAITDALKDLHALEQADAIFEGAPA